jgi:putative transposase
VDRRYLSRTWPGRHEFTNDVSDAKWAILAPLLPPLARTSRESGRTMRRPLIAILFVPCSGCPSRIVTWHLPPYDATYVWFTRCRGDGTRQAVNHHHVADDGT